MSSCAGGAGPSGTLSCVITMPLSESEKELLLSASLDGALSPEEQTLLDQWFQEDPSALRQYEELAEARARLRAALGPLRQAKLGEQFAQRVVDAAIQQAQAENLASSHPLVRLADQAASTERAGSVPRWRWAAVAVALAASLLLAIYLARSPQGVPIGPQDLAQTETNDPLAPAPAIEQLAVDDRAANGNTAPAPDPAATDGQGRGGEPVDPALMAGKSGTPSTSPSTGLGREPMAAEPPAAAPLLADAPPAVTAPRNDAADGSAQRVPLLAVLVVSVELTPAGRESLALRQALREADIQLGPAGAVEEQVVAQLRESQVLEESDEADSAQLYYIEAPAKQLDRFLLRLMAEKDSFASFAFSIVDNPGLLASVDDWRQVDPTTLRHADRQGLARDLVFADGTPLGIDPGPAFIPMSREMDTAGLLVPSGDASSSEDVPSQILLLIR